MFTRTDLDTLLAHGSGPALSFFLPTHPAGREIRQDPVRLRNLVAEAVERLTGGGMRLPDAEALLAPVRELIANENFWRHQDHGLAVYVAKGAFRYFCVPVRLEEKVIIGAGFHVMPLLPLLGEDAPFLVLTLSARRARVFRGCRVDLRECEDVPIPRQGVAEIEAETNYENTLHASSLARNNTPKAGEISGKHNFGETPEEMRKAQLVEYLRRVATGFNRWLAGGKAPIVLVAQPEIRGNFKATDQFAGRSLLELDMNPDTLDEGELHRRAYELVRPRLAKDCTAQLDHFKSLFNDGSAKSTDKVEGIVKAARYGQVDVLLARRGARLWGRYDQEKDRVLVHGEPAEEDEDLLDLAAKDVLRHGGRVFLVGENALRQGQTAGAILRFSQPR
jgi:Bacterial archaeo-eukaryotic release factor family 3